MHDPYTAYDLDPWFDDEPNDEDLFEQEFEIWLWTEDAFYETHERLDG